MPAAIIKINGVAGSNTDLPIDTSVVLTNQDAGGEITYAWSIVDQPDGTADVLSGSSGPSVTFTPKKEGTYLLRLVVNSTLSNQVVAAVRHLKTRIRIPAGSETNEAASAPRGWATSANITLGLIDATKADPGMVVGQAGASLARGDVVRLSGVATIKSGLPGQEVVPTWVKAAADTTGNTRGLLGIVEGAVDGGSITSGSLINVRLRGLFQGATIGGSPSSGAQVFLADTAGTSSTSAGTNRRLIGRIVSGSGPWNISFDGAGLYDDAVAVGSFVPTTRTLQGTSPIVIGGGYTPVDLSNNRVIAFAISGEQDEDVLVRKAGAWTRLAKGANGTYLGVTAGVVGYSAPSGTIYSAGAGLTLTGNTFAADFGTSAGEVLEGSNDALYVKLAGAQTVTGAKTFAADVTLGTGARIIEDTGSGLVTVYEYLSGQHELGTTGVPLRLSGGATLALRNATNNRLELTSTGVDILTGSTRKFTLTSGVHIGISNISRVSGEVSAQTRFIVGTGAANASASFEMQSTTTGWLGPKLTTAQRNAIASPATSLLIWNTTDGEFQYYTGSAWASFATMTGGSPFYFAGVPGSGPGGSNPKYATLTAMMNAMVADGASGAAPRVGFFTGTLTENPTLRDGVFIRGLGDDPSTSRIIGRVDFQPLANATSGLANCVIDNSAASGVEAFLFRPAAGSGVRLQDVIAYGGTGAGTPAFDLDGSIDTDDSIAELSGCYGQGVWGIRVERMEVRFSGAVRANGGPSLPARGLRLLDNASLLFERFPSAIDRGAAYTSALITDIQGACELTDGADLYLGFGVNVSGLSDFTSGPIYTETPLFKGSDDSTLMLAGGHHFAMDDQSVYLFGTDDTFAVNLHGDYRLDESAYPNAEYQTQAGVTVNGIQTLRPGRVEIITGTATINRRTNLAIIIPGSGSTFTVTTPDPTGFGPERELEVKYSGGTNKQDLTLAAHTTGGIDYDAARDAITLKWNDAWDFRARAGKWITVSRYDANPSGGGSGGYTYVPLFKGLALSSGSFSQLAGGGAFRTAEHDLTGGRTIKLRAVLSNDSGGSDTAICRLEDAAFNVIGSVSTTSTAFVGVLSADLSASFTGNLDLVCYLSGSAGAQNNAMLSAELVIGP